MTVTSEVSTPEIGRRVMDARCDALGVSMAKQGRVSPSPPAPLQPPRSYRRIGSLALVLGPESAWS
jgi:hypothetical protein